MRRSVLTPRLEFAAVALILVVTILRIVATYGELSEMKDEPAHLGAGMEWVDQGRYTYEYQHVPLARIAVAVGPYLLGARSLGQADYWEEGSAILGEDPDTYRKRLAAARAGMLPFLVLAALVTWGWARRVGGPVAGVLALLLFVNVPPVLAIAGAALTDFPVTAFIGAALFAFTWWLEAPSSGRAVILGLAVGGALLSKLTALLFLPLGGIAIMTWRLLLGPSGSARLPWRPVLGQLGLAGLVAAVLIWSVYRFEVGSLANPANRPYETLEVALDHWPRLKAVAYSVVEAPVLPAHGWFRGILEAREHAQAGHYAYLLGEVRTHGWWYYFPLLIAVKTPLPFLILALAGLGVTLVYSVRSKTWQIGAPPLSALLILLISLTSTVNLGLRYALPVYLPVAVTAGAGCVLLFRRLSPRVRTGFGIAVSGLLVWQLVGTVRAHPDYIAWFNALAAGRPERIVVGPDLVQGQDLKRLADTLRARGIQEVKLALFTPLRPREVRRLGLPEVRTLWPADPATGWIAVDDVALYGGRVSDSIVPLDSYQHLQQVRPVSRIGKSILLLHLPAP